MSKKAKNELQHPIEAERERDAKHLFVLTLMALAGQDKNIPHVGVYPLSPSEHREQLRKLAAEFKFDPTAWIEVSSWLTGDDKALKSWQAMVVIDTAAKS
jgi:hypothetical protein